MPDLDDAYANRPYIPDADAFPPRWEAEAAAFREALGPRAVLGVSYGPSARQAYDLFHPEAERLGTMIFVHGGYWRAFDRSAWSHFATGALERDWSVAMPSYDLCPAVRIATITQQIAEAVQEIAARLDGPLTLAGHSAGGHLVARMLAPGMLPAKLVRRIRHVVPISPLADLEPLCQTEMNSDFRLDVDMARAESPMLQPPPRTPVTLWVGGAERPAFLDQAMWLADAWQAPQNVRDGLHHFNIIDDLKDPNSDLMALLAPGD